MNIRYFSKKINTYGLRGILLTIYRRIIKRIREKLFNFINFGSMTKQINDILKKHSSIPIIISSPIVDWNIPLLQRPQHIALNLSEVGCLYFFCTPNKYDEVFGFQKIDKVQNLYVTNQYKTIIKSVKSFPNKYFHLYAQDKKIKLKDIDKLVNSGFNIIYEYIDALTDELYSSKSKVIERHLRILKDERCIVICTAQKLYNEVLKYRSNNVVLVTNGVNYEHFAQKFTVKQMPKEINYIVKKRKPIIGYYGAFASWFDYELVKKIAKERLEYEVILLGWDFDGSLDKSRIKEINNINVLGPINYDDLPKYSYWFDVSIIPFKINEITESTSPVKLFEYMAAEHPIVTTDMPECKKYKSVLIGTSAEDFLEKLDYALKLKNNKIYKEILQKEALENTWIKKANDIYTSINKVTY